VRYEIEQVIAESSELCFQTPAVSPDGKHSAYSPLRGLDLRSIDEEEARFIFISISIPRGKRRTL
jgi:hypothetical protein